MRTIKTEGWVFDAYPEREGMRVWALDRDGRYRDFLDPWNPCFYIEGPDAAVERAVRALASRPYPIRSRRVHRTELFSGESRPVLEVRVPPTAYRSAVEVVGGLEDPRLSLHNADIHPVQAYHYERTHFPTALCRFEVRDGRLLDWELRDSPWSVEYELPPLRIAHLALTRSEVAGELDPNHAPRGSITISMDGTRREFLGEDAEQLDSLERWVDRYDPDVLTSDWGDTYILPRLTEIAAKAGRRFSLSRDPGRTVGGRASRSFFTYGRTVYQGGAQYLFGRWHLDLKNSFTLKESRLTGLLEVARIAKIPVQRCARTTIGTSLTSMQLDQAWRDGVLVPLNKQQTEDFRPATDLLTADKGGLAYEPEVGWFGNAAEYDFVSMYPTLMVKWNISPETVNCPCCPSNVVPEIGHHLCRKRAGLVPKVLAPILDKRIRYKALAKSAAEGREAYKLRANAHKWILVCCFGYLGFKNARFGKIEAHECVTACGREVLLRAKEAVESRGHHMLHALVDSLWLLADGRTDWEELRLEIEAATGCPVGLEGVYDWIRFCPSKRDALSGVPGRYFGAFPGGELKVRGLACRRHDTPALIKAMQGEMLGRLAEAGSLSACRTARAELEEIVESYRLRLKEGQVTAQDLAITFSLSKSPEEYVHDTVSSLAAKMLAGSGVLLHPGEPVRYVIVASKEKVKEWRVRPLALMEDAFEYDSAKYLELLNRAAAEILAGL